MHPHLLLALALIFLASLALALEPPRPVSIFAWPLSASNPTPLAHISYNSTAATIDSYTPFTPPPDSDSDSDSLVRVGFTHPSGAWSGIATAAANFAPARDKTLQLHVTAHGELYHVGFKASEVAGGSHGTVRGSKKGDLSVEVVGTKAGLPPALNKPVVVNPDGSLPEKPEEKSFFQKYWWLIGGFLLLQVVMGGAKGE